jgi:hypothetical protein
VQLPGASATGRPWVRCRCLCPPLRLLSPAPPALLAAHLQHPHHLAHRLIAAMLCRPPPPPPPGRTTAGPHARPRHGSSIDIPKFKGKCFEILPVAMGRVKHRDMASAAGAVVLEITDASSSTVGDVPSSPPPPPVPVSDLARLDPLPSPTVAVRADRQRQARALQPPI